MVLENYFSDSIDDILFDYEFIKKNNHLKYLNVPVVFDIETTSFYQQDVKQAIMYAWTFGINGKSIRGRTWDEFVQVIDKLIKHYNLTLEKRIIIYVHNLSFEFQFLNHYFKWEKVFSLEERKPIYAITTDGIEFRCSYILTNQSLEQVGKNLLKYKVEKKTGDLDYKLIRHSKTPLSDIEWGYILNDGLVVMAKIGEEIESCGGIHKIPLTSTSYVRRYVTESCLQKNNDCKFDYSKTIRKLTLNQNEYILSKRAFSGGFTHANINYVNKTIKDVHSIDFTSSYPTVMISEQFPMSKPHKYTPVDKMDFLQMINKFCCMFTIKFNDICAKVKYENYISISKCLNLESPIVNNGRIIEADSLTITITEQDYFIIQDLYEWKSMQLGDFYYCYKGYLPKPIIESILNLYVKKTTLKDVEGKEKEYQQSKAMLNSVYGMCVTDICKDEFIFNNDYEWTTEKVNYDEVLKAYNTNKQRVLYYLWGVWVTAYSRRNLFSGINEFKMDYIYSDTDSIKCINYEKHIKYVEEYNKNITKKLLACLSHYRLNPELINPKTIKGVNKPLGVWDYEGKYEMFKTLGAKRYIYVKENNRTEGPYKNATHSVLYITIAGVAKKNGAKYLMDKYKTFDNVFKNFKEGLYFPSNYAGESLKDFNATGKLTHTYIDLEMKGKITDYLGNTSKYHEYSGVHLEPTDYNLSLDDGFKNIILGLEKGEFLIA